MRQLRSIFLISLIFGLVIYLFFSEMGVTAVSWNRLGDDLELAEVATEDRRILSPQVTLLRSTLKRYRLNVIPASRSGLKNTTVKRLSKLSGAVLGINANFFDEHGEPLGVVLNNGNLMQSMHRGGNTLTGIFQIANNKPSIVGRNSFDPNGVLEAVQAGPRIIVAGKAQEKLRELDVYERRAGVCVDGNDRVILFISSGIMGISFRELLKVLLHPDIACVEALNLDGGGSAQLYVSADIPGASAGMREISLPGSDSIPVMLGLLLK